MLNFMFRYYNNSYAIKRQLYGTNMVNVERAHDILKISS